MGAGKPRGINCARKLKNKRRLQLWNDKDYNKAHIGSKWKKPFACASQAKGIVIEKLGVEAKQPNSAVRKAVRVQLKKNGKKITAFVPSDGCINYINENDEVVVTGLGRKGHSVGDLPGVRYKVVIVKGKALIALYRGKCEITR
jgi:small subunit ribosomal protein S23e